MFRFVKSIHELEQAPKELHVNFENVTATNEFKIYECDNCIYAKSTHYKKKDNITMIVQIPFTSN